MSSIGVEYSVGPFSDRPTLQQLESEGKITYIRVQWVDVANIIRMRVLPLSYFKKLLNTSRPCLPLLTAGLGMSGPGMIAEGFSFHGETSYVFDLATLKVCPWAPGHWSVMGWFQDNATTASIAICPRTVLARLINDIEKSHSVRFLAGFETEFNLINPNKEQRPSAEPHPWSASSALYAGRVEAIVMQEIADALQASGIELQMYHFESAPGQYEVVTGPLPPLEAADALVHTRDTIYNIANKHGLRATFAPRLYSNAPGNGAHLHLSVHESDPGRPLSEEILIDGVPLRRGEASFLSGLLNHLPSILLLTQPTAASYDRVKDGVRSGGTYVCWGVDHKEVPLRLCNSTYPKTRNLEVKMIDGTANPYLALAGVLAAGSIGIRAQSPLLQKPLQTHATAADLSASEREQLGISSLRLPRHLQEARQLFRGDDALKGVLGEEFVETYLRVNDAVNKYLVSLGSDGITRVY